jgi:hypothetical protein
MRSLAECAGFADGITNTVSDRLNSRAICLHRGGVQAFGVEHDRELIAGEGAVGEDVEDAVAAGHGLGRQIRR